MSPEGQIIADLLDQIDRSARGLQSSLGMIAVIPNDVAAFEGMDVMTGIATTALLKQFEQLEDALARLFRTSLKHMGISVKGLYPLDIANRMVELDVLDDAPAWLAAVKLRNELVHEYPFDAASRFARLSRAHSAVPMLFDAARRARTLVEDKGLLA